MLNVSPQELLLILLVALLVVGPRRLPELGRSLGKGLRELRKAQDEIRRTIRVDLDDEEERAAAGRRGTARDRGAPGTTDDDGRPRFAAEAGARSESEAAEVSRSLGRGLAEIRRARREIQRSFRVDLDAPRSTGRPSPGRAASRRSSPSTGERPDRGDATAPTTDPDATARPE